MMKHQHITLVLGLLVSCTAFGDGVPAESDNPVNQVKSMSDEQSTVSEKLFEFYASDKAAQLKYERDGSVVSVDNGRIHLGFLFDEERDNIFTGGVVLDSTPVFLKGLTLSIGGKVYAALLGAENSDVFGLGMGIEAAYILPVKQFPLLLDAEFYYAPDILSFGQSDRIFDWEVNAGLQLRKTVIGFVGFRFLQFDTRPGNQKPDNAVHVGVRWLFEN